MNVLIKQLIYETNTKPIKKYIYYYKKYRGEFKILSWKIGKYIKIQGLNASRPRLIKGDIKNPKLLSYNEFHRVAATTSSHPYAVSFGENFKYVISYEF